jgi:geranylgeranyl pyrophosphate synthase
MKNFDWDALIPPMFLVGFFLVITMLIGNLVYGQYLDAYNTQKDREMFLKTYEIVLECRKTGSVINMDKVCGEIPSFISEVS